MPTCLRARVVFPVDAPPIENGVVTIDGQRIVAIGTSADYGNVIALGSAALLPGVVNAHTHLEFSYLRQPLGTPGMSIVDWIRLVIAERGRLARSASETLVCGVLESIFTGVTTVGDISTGAVESLPWPLDATVYHEVIGFSRARAESALSALVERLDISQRALGVVDAETRTGAQLGISPHAPYTVSPQLLKELVSLAGSRKLPVAMHLAESLEELQFLRAGAGPLQALLDERSMWDADAIPQGSRALDYLRMLAGAPQALVIHGNYLDDEELAFLAANRERMSVVYCPRTHAYFRHSEYPLAKALAMGVRMALGTDSRASNPDLNLLDEMRFVARAHPAISPQDVLRMGTLAGAEALGWGRTIGSLTAGKLANMVAVPISDDARGTPDDVLASVLASDEQASAVWIRGALVKKRDN